MSALPESFDVAKRIGLFVYMANHATKPLLITDFFVSYKSDISTLESELLDYGEQCKNPSARRRLSSGLVSKTGETSFSKYARMGNWLGYFDFDVKTGILKPNWVTYILHELSQQHKPKNHFDLSVELKLLSTYLLIQNDRNLIIPLIQALDTLKPNCKSISTPLLQKHYLRNVLASFEDSLNTMPSSTSFYNATRRIHFFRKNLSLLESGRSPTRGIEHMIEPRINWLLDLGLVEHSCLCSTGLVKPIESCNQLRNDSNNQDAFFESYLSKIKTKSLSGNNLNIEDTVSTVTMKLKTHYGEVMVVEPVLLFTWLLINSQNQEYTKFDAISNRVQNLYPIYRRKMGGLGFIQL